MQQRSSPIDRTLHPTGRGGSPTLSTREAATLLDVTERTVRRAIARGDLPASKGNGVYRLWEQDVAAYAARTQRPSPPEHASTARYLPEQLLAEHTAANSSYIDRPALQDTLTGWLLDSAVRIVTLTGPGGAGKSRLAQAAATQVAAHYPDGVVFVPLATVFDPSLVAPAIAEALRVPESAGVDLSTLIAAALTGTRRLVVLDNFEQILAAARLVAWMAALAPECTFLVTSRAPLHLRGEQELPVPPMRVAAAGASVEEVLASEAVQLFVTRVREHLPVFTVGSENAPLIAEICRELDGLPLAIELAATRVKTLGLEHLRQQLHRRLRLLAGGPADAPQRHRTMQNAITWSYDLLSGEQRRVFRHLAVCVGGCTLEVSLSLAGTPDHEPARPGDTPADPDFSVLDHMATLVDQSLLTVEADPNGALRYGMLATIREFGLSHLTADEHARTRKAHARFFLDLAWRHRLLLTTRATSAPVRALAADLENIRAALEWLDQAGPDADFARMVAATYIFMFACGHFAEGAAWLQRAQARAQTLPPLEQALLQVGVAERLMVNGELATANAAFASVLPLVRAVGTPFDIANALISSGVALVYSRSYAAGEAQLREALALADMAPVGQVQASTLR